MPGLNASFDATLDYLPGFTLTIPKGVAKSDSHVIEINEVTGRVLDADSRAIPKATIAIAPWGDSERRYYCVADRDGRFRTWINNAENLITASTYTFCGPADFGKYDPRTIKWDGHDFSCFGTSGDYLPFRIEWKADNLPKGHIQDVVLQRRVAKSSKAIEQ